MENLERFFSFFFRFWFENRDSKIFTDEEIEAIRKQNNYIFNWNYFFIFVNNNLFFIWRYMILVINPFKLNNSFNCKTICLKEHKIIMK